MFNLISKTQNRQSTPLVAVDALWYVEANPSYQIVRDATPIPADLRVGIRTFGGGGEITLKDGSSCFLKENSLFLIASDHIQSYGCTKDKWEFCWFDFYVSPGVFRGLYGVHQIPPTDEEITYIKKMYSLLNEEKPYASLLASSIFLCFLCEWNRAILNDRTVPENQVQPAIQYMDLNFKNDIPIHELCRLCSMSERSFRDRFKEVTGLSPKKYLEDKRMETARRMIISTSLKISTIAASVGYENPFYFSKCFKDTYGLSPQQFRNALRQPF